ncbi:MAG: mannose-1-phosphate guanylyltransferase [Bdellovibrionales bacterium]|nr:mannose-1-phosphate guanylyltransferase [Bdellovibrionales bacterium]
MKTESYMSEEVAAVILAGGQGSRFWPLSRKHHPKQFLSLGEDGESLIQATVYRLEALMPRERIVVITASHLEDLVKEHVPGVQILSEPFGRNTAAAIALGAKWLDDQGFSGVMLALPADHAVKDNDKLLKTLDCVVSVAKSGDELVTIGIAPQRPDTAFGYIQRGQELPQFPSAENGGRVYKVKRFFEKPNEQRAKQYLESGEFYWNSGMFAWQPKVFLEALKKFLPDMHAEFMKVTFSTDCAEATDIVRDLYERIESISVDFGIMEHATNVKVVEAYDYGWNDVGSWDAWAEHFERDSLGNMLKGDCVSLGGGGNIVSSSSGRFVALVGTTDLVVIDSEDATLVCPRESVQDVKKVVSYLEKKGRSELI